MNEYLFITPEGATYAPNNNTAIENCQLLGRIQASSVDAARVSLLSNNPWIQQVGFDVDKSSPNQVITKEQRKDIKDLIDYLWKDAKQDYYTQNCPSSHIFLTLNRLIEMTK